MTEKQTIKEKQDSHTVSIKLTAEELTRLKNQALRAGFDDEWRLYVAREFKEKVTQSLIGAPTVGGFKKITAPSRHHGN